MTTWIEQQDGGRERGPLGLLRSWIAVLTSPREFFRTGIAPGTQAPGLSFAIVVAVLHVTTWFTFNPPRWSILQFVLVYLLIAVFLTPLSLHLAGAIVTVPLVPLVSERAGVSKTIQVIAYATAPCVLPAFVLPVLWIGVLPLSVLPVLWALTGGYSVALLVVGIARVHDTSMVRACIVSGVPAVIVFGYGFRGLHILLTAML